MNRLIATGIASLVLTAAAVAAPPLGPPTTRPRMPSPPVRVVIPVRPVAPVIVVPTTGAPRPYLNPAPIITPPIIAPRSYAVYYRYDWLSPGMYYGTYSSLHRAEDAAFLLEYAYGVDAWVR